jgi:hypothetical protein
MTFDVFIWLIVASAVFCPSGKFLAVRCLYWLIVAVFLSSGRAVDHDDDVPVDHDDVPPLHATINNHGKVDPFLAS